MPETRSAWKVIAASVAGTSHLAAGLPCQDAFACRVLPNGALVAAMGDGAGSAKYAGEASRRAADAALECLAFHCAGPLESAAACKAVLEHCLAVTRACLEQAASAGAGPRSETVNLQDFATTLLAAFVTDGFFGALQVGDGAIVVRETPDVLTVAFQPDHGEYLNETCFVTSDDMGRSARYRVAPGDSVDAVAILSDGLEMLAIVYRDNTAHGPFFTPLFDFVRGEGACVEDLEEFLKSERVCERSDDDKTIVLAVRVP